VIGITGRMRVGDGGRWLMHYYLDLGTGNSKLTWQGLVGIGYTFNWGSLVASWRYIDYEFKSGQVVESLKFSGPAVGLVFRVQS
jgi:hypothetical protein